MTSSPDYPDSLNSSYSSYYDWDNYVAHTLTWYIIVGTILVSLFMVTIIGNLFVMVAFYRDRRINSKIANWYIVNLSVADFIVGLISLPLTFCWMIHPWEYWPFGEIICKIYLFIDYVATLVPALTIICISLDRYWLLTKKLDYPKVATKKKAAVFIVSIWTLCISVYGVLTFAWIPITGFEEVIEYEWNCELEATYNFECQVVIIVLFFFGPLVTIMYLNYIVYRNIRDRSTGFVQSKPTSVETKKEQSTSVDAKNETDGSNTAPRKDSSDISMVSLKVQNSKSNVKSNRTAKANGTDTKQKEFNRHRKAAITLAVLVGVFIVCWLPFYLMVLLGTLCDYCVPDLAWTIASYLLWSNSTINPFLYAAMNPNFRDNFVKFLCLDKLKKKQPASMTLSKSGGDYKHNSESEMVD